MSTASAAPALRAGIVTALQALFPADQVLVTRGVVAFDTYNDIIVVGPATAESEFATFSSSLRSREETLTLTVDFYAYRAGGAEQEPVTEARVYAMQAALETYLRFTDTTVGGTVRHCFMTAHVGDAATDQDVLAQGRLHIVSATLTAQNRITS